MPKESQKLILNVNLRDQRKQRGWTQAIVAKDLGVTDLTVRRWERGQTTPSAYHVKKLCDLFKEEPEKLGLAQKSEPPEREHNREQLHLLLTYGTIDGPILGISTPNETSEINAYLENLTPKSSRNKKPSVKDLPQKHLLTRSIRQLYTWILALTLFGLLNPVLRKDTVLFVKRMIVELKKQKIDG